MSQHRYAHRLLALIPPAGLPRSLATQTLLYSAGLGIFLTGNIVFFTQRLQLSAAAVGLGISIASGVSMLATLPLGRLADRYSGQAIWAGTTLFQALVYASYPWLSGFTGFLIAICLISLSEGFGGLGRTAYTLNSLPAEQRVRTMAFLRSALNIGFTLGALVSGLVLSFHSTTLLLILPLGTAAMMLVNAAFIAGLPRLQRVVKAVRGERAHPLAIKNLPFVRLALANGVLATNATVLNVVLPLWLVTMTDAPKAMVAWLFILNTVMVVVLQVRLSAGAETVAGAARTAGRSAWWIFLACLVAMASHWTENSATIVALVLVYGLLTLGEIKSSAGDWGLFSELSPAAARAEYQAVWRLGSEIPRFVAPALFTALAITAAPWGWIPLAVVFLIAGVIMPAISRRVPVPAPAESRPGTETR